MARAKSRVHLVETTMCIGLDYLMGFKCGKPIARSLDPPSPTTGMRGDHHKHVLWVLGAPWGLVPCHTANPSMIEQRSKHSHSHQFSSKLQQQTLLPKGHCELLTTIVNSIFSLGKRWVCITLGSLFIGRFDERSTNRSHTLIDSPSISFTTIIQSFHKSQSPKIWPQLVPFCAGRSHSWSSL
jgi:hypothetical protein